MRIIDSYIYHFETLQTIVQALKTLDTLTPANTNGRDILRSVWKDKYEIESGVSHPDPPLVPPIGRMFVYRGKLRLVLVEYIYYSQTDCKFPARQVFVVQLS